MKGELSKKFKQKYIFILFNDSIMYGTHTKTYKFHNLIELANSRVNDLTSVKYPLTFQFVSTIKSFIITAPTQEEYNKWLITLQNYINQSFNKQAEGYHMKWKVDSTAPYCMGDNCTSSFKFYDKRNMCGHCGRVYCDDCAKSKGRPKTSLFRCNKCLNIIDSIAVYIFIIFRDHHHLIVLLVIILLLVQVHLILLHHLIEEVLLIIHLLVMILIILMIKTILELIYLI